MASKWIAGLALASAASPFHVVARQEAELPPLSEVARLLLQAIGDPRNSASELEDALAARDAAEVPELVHTVVSGGVACTIAPGRTIVIPLNDGVQRTTIAALGRLRRRVVIDALEDVALGMCDDAGRAVALQVLAAIGREDDLELAARIAAPCADEAASGPARRDAFAESVRAICERSPHAIEGASRLFSSVAPEIACATVRAFGGLARETALDPLARLLGQRDDADALILSEITRLAGSSPPASNVDAPEAVRHCLSRADEEVVVAAIRACGALEDAESVPLLVGCMEAGNAIVARSSRDALRHIARVDFGHDFVAWRQWYERETVWWDDESDQAAWAVRFGDATQAANAILAFSRSRLHRHRAAELLVHGLERDEPALVQMCCGALGDTASPRGVEALEHALERPEPPVRDAARKALRRIGTLPATR